MKRVIFCLLYIVFILPLLNAKVKLPAIIGDNMVLQQNTYIKLWGWAEQNSRVTIKIPWLKESISVKVDCDGNWECKVKTPNYGGPYSFSFSDGEIVTIDNIYIGEVWLCSGQSNMEMPVKGFHGQPVKGSNDAIARANSKTPIHMFTLGRIASNCPVDSIIGKWTEHNSIAVANFSAVGYFFGYELYKSLNIPIGLINSSWGASNIEAWMPEDILSLYPEIPLDHLKYSELPVAPQDKGALLHNGMLYPLRNYSIRGVIWYQGESNIMRPKPYEKLFIEFVNYIRKLFDNPQLPFYYAQIAPFDYIDDKTKLCSALLRETQLECESKIDNVGMAVLMDIGDEKFIHAPEKKTVGKRLAYLALNNDYGFDGVMSKSPKYVSKIIEGKKIKLKFDATMGLTSFGEELTGFEIAGNDSIFYPAKAMIINRSDVEAYSDYVKEPIAVRYCFHNYAKGSLFGISGLPVSSFKTDF